MPRWLKIHRTRTRADTRLQLFSPPGLVRLHYKRGKLQRCHLQARLLLTLGAVCSESQTGAAATVPAVQSGYRFGYLSAGWFPHCFTRSHTMPARERARSPSGETRHQAALFCRSVCRRGSLGCRLPLPPLTGEVKEIKSNVLTLVLPNAL